jgi:hypothetical protein
MNSAHVVKNEIQCLKHMGRSVFTGEQYVEFCERLGRIENCYNCLDKIIKGFIESTKKS